MINKQLLRILSLLLGLFYTLFVEYGAFPLNLAGSIFFIALFLILGVLYKKDRILNMSASLLGLVGIGVAFYLSFTTNPLMVFINSVTLMFISNILFIGLFNQKLPQTVTDYASSFIMGIRGFATESVSLDTLKQFFSLRMSLTRLSVHKNYIWGAILALPILWVFHLLFSQVNKEYVYFMSHIIDRIADVIRYILDIDIIQTVLKTVIAGYILFCMFVARKSSNVTKDKAVYSQYELVQIILGSIVLLFAVFSYFQGKLLTTVNFSKLAFRDLSLYTQQGFWELLLISIIGYILSLIFIRFTRYTSHIFSIKNMLLLYVSELILICLFSYHKLFYLQSMFGFKDQRILATCAVSLITMTFVLFLGRILGKVKSSVIFTSQYLGFIIIVLLLNVINIDSFTTYHNPIRFYIKNTAYLDHSYLLGNSYDNTSAWLTLMKEVEDTGMPLPEGYYWGAYKSLCNNDWDQSGWNSVWGREYKSYIEKRYTYLNTKYASVNYQNDLKRIGSFNIHEYDAYRILKDHKGEVKKFLDFIHTRCSHRR